MSTEQTQASRRSAPRRNSLRSEFHQEERLGQQELRCRDKSIASRESDSTLLFAAAAVRQRSETEFAESRVIVRTAAERPLIETVRFPNRKIVNRSMANFHESLFIELPVFVSV